MTFGSVVRQAARRIASTIASAPPWLVLLVSWLVLMLYAYPGLMTQDSFDHLAEARTGKYTDWHPPAVSLLWKFLDYVVAGPLGMLVLQSATFLVGLYYVLRRTLQPKAAAWAAGLLFVFPPVMLPFAVIWKDNVMAGFLMLGLAAMPAERRWVRIAGLVALGAATAVRYNAFGATLPIIVLLFEWRPGLHWLKRYAIAGAAWFAVTFAAFSLNDAITDYKMHPWQSSLALYDIVGTLAHVDEDLPDAELRRVFEGTQLLTKENIHAQIRKLYTPRDFLPIINHATEAMWAVPIWGIEPTPAPQRDAIGRAFLDVVTAHPGAYAAHRLDVMAEVLCLTAERPAAVIIKREYRRTDLADAVGATRTWSKLQRKMTTFMTWLYKATPIFVPWIYLVISLLLLPMARRNRAVLATLASGLVFESSLLFLAASPDYRYSHWMVVCALMAVIELTASRMRPNRGTVSTSPPLSA
ncbi:MAG: hypothetical protein SFX73_02020 [Kofleriaceae bacterium]|nr:hypothetical protein [Kofleriaceae bacterium]